MMRRTKGRELPGTFKSMIATDLFLKQCRPWGRSCVSMCKASGTLQRASSTLLRHGLPAHQQPEHSSRSSRASNEQNP
jgi:hypothetical protein